MAITKLFSFRALCLSPSLVYRHVVHGHTMLKLPEVYFFEFEYP